MAGMFYSLQEAAKKLGKSDEQVKELVKGGKLREFRDGANLLFKVDEVDSLLANPTVTGGAKTAPEPELQLAEDEISLAPDSETHDLKEFDSADTAATTEGINILSETSDDFKLSDDTMGATQATGEPVKFDGSELEETKLGPAETTSADSQEASIKEIEDDVNLDTFGSGSGLLDLSLQADDTSLGGILDEIYTAPGNEEAQAAAEPSDVTAATEQMFPESSQPAFEAAAIMAAVAVEPEPDTKSNILGILLVLPMLLVIYTVIVIIASMKGIRIGIFSSIQGIIPYIIIGLAAVVAIGGVACVIGGGSSGPKPPKPPKPPKEKKVKPPKEKKEKPAKEKK